MKSLALAPLLLCLGLPAAAQQPQDMAALCNEAAARYKELFGKDFSSEPQPVVLMYNYRFCPPDLKVKAGQKVRFVNVDRRTSHSVWLKKDGRPESERVFSGDAIEVTADLAEGEHEVLCGPHWEREGMIGKLTVAK